MRCEYKACASPATPNSKFCAYHAKEQQVVPAQPIVEPDEQIVSIAAIPHARSNEVSLDLLKAVKALSATNAMKVRLRKFPKTSLLTMQRYGLTEGLRIGVRFVGDWAYLWKLTPEQIKAAEDKAARLVSARTRTVNK